MIYTVDDVPRGTKAFLDGAEILDVIKADPEKGLVTHFKRDEGGGFIVVDGTDELLQETLRGRVRIEFPEWWVA